MSVFEQSELPVQVNEEIVNQPETNEYLLSSELENDNTRLRVTIEVPSLGYASTFFVRNNRVGPNGEIIVSSGYVHAEPTSNGLGDKLLHSLSSVLDNLAHKTGHTIIHPLHPTSEDSQRFFERYGYISYVGKEQKLVQAEPEDVWSIRTIEPSNDPSPLTPQEETLFNQFKILENFQSSTFSHRSA